MHCNCTALWLLWTGNGLCIQVYSLVVSSKDEIIEQISLRPPPPQVHWFDLLMIVENVWCVCLLRVVGKGKASSILNNLVKLYYLILSTYWQPNKYSKCFQTIRKASLHLSVNILHPRIMLNYGSHCSKGKCGVSEYWRINLSHLTYSL